MVCCGPSLPSMQRETLAHAQRPDHRKPQARDPGYCSGVSEVGKERWRVVKGLQMVDLCVLA